MPTQLVSARATSHTIASGEASALMHVPDETYLNSCAYHEAGHTVVAVTLGMPLRNRGIHIDTKGNGIAYYWFRTPENLDNSPQDIIERERTIISTEAGFIAQRKFYASCPPGGNLNDRDQSIKLLDEMYQNRNDWIGAQQRLLAQAERLVETFWGAIEALATALLAKPLTVRADDPERQWSTDRLEKWIDGSEVVSILRQCQLEPVIREESEGIFYPDVKPGAVEVIGSCRLLHFTQKQCKPGHSGRSNELFWSKEVAR